MSHRYRVAVATPRPAPGSRPGGSRAIGKKASDRLHRAPRSESDPWPVPVALVEEVRARVGIGPGRARRRWRRGGGAGAVEGTRPGPGRAAGRLWRWPCGQQGPILLSTTRRGSGSKHAV